MSLIGATTSTAGLKVYAQLDENAYKRDVKISNSALAAVNLHPDDFHGEWNYPHQTHHMMIDASLGMVCL